MDPPPDIVKEPLEGLLSIGQPSTSAPSNSPFPRPALSTSSNGPKTLSPSPTNDKLSSVNVSPPSQSQTPPLPLAPPPLRAHTVFLPTSPPTASQPPTESDPTSVIQPASEESMNRFSLSTSNIADKSTMDVDVIVPVETLSTNDKTKSAIATASAPEPEAETIDIDIENPGGHDEDETNQIEGRSKRVRKKRQLSASEVDPTSLRPDGSLPKRSRPRVYRPSGALPIHLRSPQAEDLPLTKDDEAYFARVTANSLKPEVGKTGYCPVWATTRRALQAAAEYLRDPVRTEGASVQIGAGGIARGIILEGKVPGQGFYWGEGEDAGTIITAIGPPRPRGADSSVLRASFETAGWHDFPRPDTLADEILRATPSPIGPLVPTYFRNGSSTPAQKSPQSEPPVSVETPAIDALLMAHRARTPIAIAVGHDYEPVPFKVPQPFVVLGWFWIVDAWPEPILDIKLFQVEQERPMHAPTEIVWKFRFEWCEGSQSTCWWTKEDDPPRKSTPFYPQLEATPSWPVSGPGIENSRTIKPVDTPDDPEWLHNCTQCGKKSSRVYAQGEICLNEACHWFFGDVASSPDHVGPTSSKPAPLKPLLRLLPEQLGLQLRPILSRGHHLAIRQDIHVDRWQGWVCKRCGCANEARSWSNPKCEACQLPMPSMDEHVFTHDVLRDPSRPVCTGTRQDDGFAQWPFPTKRSAAVYADDIKIVRHGMEEAFGGGAAVFHVLGHEGKNVNLIANSAVVALQRSQTGRRCRMPLTSRRSSERVWSPFFTIQLGQNGAPSIPHFPAKGFLPWKLASQVHLQLADLINERAGRVFPGEAEFNSLLVATVPSHLPKNAHPLIPVGPETMISFLFLGSDGMIRFRRASTTSTVRVRWGELTVQHGDVIILKTGPNGVDVQVRTDGFGYVCIARQVYAEDDDAKAFDSSIRPSYEAGQPIAHSRSNGQNGAPHKPTKPPLAPLTNWYIGPWPLDKTQPIRCHPSARKIVDSSDDAEVNATNGDLTDPAVKTTSTIKAFNTAVPPQNENTDVIRNGTINGMEIENKVEEPTVTSFHQHTGKLVWSMAPPPSSILAPPTTPAFAKRAASMTTNDANTGTVESPSSTVSAHGLKPKQPRGSIGGKDKPKDNQKEASSRVKEKTQDVEKNKGTPVKSKGGKMKVKDDKDVRVKAIPSATVTAVAKGRAGPRASTGGIGVKSASGKNRGRRSVGGNEVDGSSVVTGSVDDISGSGLVSVANSDGIDIEMGSADVDLEEIGQVGTRE